MPALRQSALVERQERTKTARKVLSPPHPMRFQPPDGQEIHQDRCCCCGCSVVLAFFAALEHGLNDRVPRLHSHRRVSGMQRAQICAWGYLAWQVSRKNQLGSWEQILTAAMLKSAMMTVGIRQ